MFARTISDTKLRWIGGPFQSHTSWNPLIWNQRNANENARNPPAPTPWLLGYTFPVADNSTKLFSCMEVWGGNTRTDSGVVMPGLDAWVYSEPWQNETAGGDVHYLSSCASGQVVRMLVADVAGHGGAVAKLAADLRLMMRRYVNDHDQKRFVCALNREFTAASSGGVFATAVAMTFDSPTNNLLLCNAGHPAPLWYHARDKKWTYLETGQTGEANVPWGIADGVDYEQFAVRLKVNDLVLCYTDSLIEARDASGELIGQAGLLKLVQSLGEPEPVGLVAKILSAVDKHGQGSVTRDDVTCLLFRPNGLRPRVPYIDRLLGAPRVLADWCGIHFGWTGRPSVLDPAAPRSKLQGTGDE
jgi:sigma-B regulation protein RsbU (phosphoserine phosphatase)